MYQYLRRRAYRWTGNRTDGLEEGAPLLEDVDGAATAVQHIVPLPVVQEDMSKLQVANC